MTDAAVPKAKKPAAPKKVAEHPTVAVMVNAAIVALKDRKGSSLAAIKKYIAANYKVDIAKIAPFIRKYLKKAVIEGKILQVKGTGASGSFKVGKVEKPKKVKKPKKPAAKKPKKPAAKKVAKSPKKAAAKKPAAKPAAKKTPAKKPAAKKPAAKKPAAKKAAKK